MVVVMIDLSSQKIKFNTSVLDDEIFKEKVKMRVPNIFLYSQEDLMTHTDYKS
jgi:hypothetical protein